MPHRPSRHKARRPDRHPARALSAGVVLVAQILTGCSGGRTPPPPSLQSSPAAPAPTPTASPATTVPTAVPAAVLEAAQQVSSIPGNRVDASVQWVRTTYDAYRRLAGTTSTRRGASQAAEVYVVQLSGDFARLDGSDSGTGRRYRSTVVVVPSELPMSAAEDVRQSDQPLPLAALAPVSVFVLP